MKKVVIIGAGGHARVISEIVKLRGDVVVAFLDDNISLGNSDGPVSSYVKYNDCQFIIGIGDNLVREKFSKLKVNWYTAIHPNAIISATATIGEGSVVMAGAILNSGARIGRHCIINTGAIIEHDNCIDDYVHISVGVKIGGTVTIGSRSFIGIGSVIKNNIAICKDATIGAGAVVVRNIERSGIYIGVPARIKEDN